MSELSSYKLQRGHLNYLRKWLDVPVPKSQNRHRNEMIKIIQPLLDEQEISRQEILKQFAELDENGEVKQNGNLVIWLSNQAEKDAEKAYKELLGEEVLLINTKPAAFEFLKNFLAHTDKEFLFEEGVAYEELCEIFGVTTKEENTQENPSNP